MTDSKVLVICGPTASGKTSLAVKLAERYDGEVISADSIAVYKGLDVGSAKPTKEETRGIPHHMIDVADKFEEFSVSDYESMALPIVRDVSARGKLPVICGGTGFYINSLLFKMSYGSAKGNDEFRRRYDEKIANDGKLSVWNELKSVDPATANKLHYNDVVRVVRALEIFYTTGKKKSEISDDCTPRFDYFAIMPTFDREVLYERINQRVDLMIKNGLEDEVRGLIADGITLNHQCMQGIGYKESFDAVYNGFPLPVEEIKQNSRRYAKRQLTFFKRMQPYAYDVSRETADMELYEKIDDFL